MPLERRLIYALINTIVERPMPTIRAPLSSSRVCLTKSLAILAWLAAALPASSSTA
jgi:hypothetical protein